MKTCTRCSRTLELAEFNFKDRARGRYASHCRDCSRAYVRDHYARNTRYYIEKARVRNGPERLELRRRLLAFLADHPCIDCGERDPVVLHFDHLDPARKVAAVADLYRSRTTWSRIQAEIEKCAVRCANCHQRRTAQQFGWFRRGPAPAAPVAQLDRAPVFGTGGFAGSSPAGRAPDAHLIAAYLALLLRLRRGLTPAAAMVLGCLLGAASFTAPVSTPAHAADSAPTASPADPLAAASTAHPLMATSAAERSALNPYATPGCLLGRAPPLQHQMLALVAILGDATGQPLECVRANPDNGDLLQQTSTGLLIYRTTTAMAVFTNGWTHWGLGADAPRLVVWHGSGLDPPWLELAWTERVTAGAPVAVFAQTTPGASCSIDYHTPAGGLSRAVGLGPRLADPSGQTGWEFRIAPSTRRGAGRVTVTCDGTVAHAVVHIE